MADSPSKRRKTSPTISVTVNASNTPSRIPIPSQSARNTPSQRPSFASPTKASLSRHNPQLLRPSSSGETSIRPGSRGRNLQDVFAQALAETRGAESVPKSRSVASESLSTTQENDPPTEELIINSQPDRATTPKARSRNIPGSGLSAKPRRMSRSPVKRPERPPYEHPSLAAALEPGAGINPFQKKGLRRSPPPGSQQEEFPQIQHGPEDLIENPFKKTGLRRSPISSQPLTVQQYSQEVPPPHVQSGAFRRSPSALESTEIAEKTPPAQIQPSNLTPTQKPGLRRSPRLSHAPDMSDRVDPPVAETQQNQPARTSALRRSPIIPVDTFRESDSEFRLEIDVQLDPEAQELTTPKEPLPTRPSPAKAPPANVSPASAPSERPSQRATSELLRVVSSRPQEVRSKSPMLAKAPALSIVEEIMNPFKTRRYEEPELPPTPPQRGIPDPIVTTPPSGIHDTPSKRTRRRKVQSEKHKSSPLKPKNVRPEEKADAGHQQPKEVRPGNVPAAKEQQARRRSSRFIPPVDPHAAKKKERDDLLRQLQQLQADVALANQENERIRLLSEQKSKALGTAPNAEDIMAMLLRSAVPEPESKPPPLKTSIMKSLDTFLPFRPRRRPAPSPISQKPIPSHLPIAMDDPLPYLKAFSPLTYSSTLTIIPPNLDEPDSQDAQHILHKYSISATHPSGLFSAHLSLVANTTLVTILSISILKLPSSAESELGPFIRARAISNGGLGSDITVICWAMARWIEVSIQRAQFWCSVASELGTGEARKAIAQKRKKRKYQGGDGGEEEMGKEKEEMGKEKERQGKWTRKQLLPYLGRQSMEICTEDVELRFEWKIGFDYTGEAESSISADARVPFGWHELDERMGLAKVPEMFDRLVRDREPLAAVRALVGLMMS